LPFNSPLIVNNYLNIIKIFQIKKLSDG